jgi:predicted phage tail protein
MQLEKYVGIPYEDRGRDFSGVDCWGLARLIYKNEYNIDLPSFKSDYETSDDAPRLRELIAQYKEGWEKVQEPSEGDLVLFRILGSESHIGVAISSTHFIHSRDGRDSAVESFASAKWKTRIVGYFKYTENKSAILNAVPNALRTERVTLPIPAGTNLKQVIDWVQKEYGAKGLETNILVMLNGVAVPKDDWEKTIILDSDKIEYRAVPRSDKAKRVVLTLAVVVAAYVTGGTILAGMQAVGYSYAVSVTAAVVGSAFVSYVGMAAVNMIAPIRPPEDPGTPKQQNLFSGQSNQTRQYGSIPVVLGKMRYAPPLGSTNYITYESARDAYISMLLVWGYGPVTIDAATLKIGETALTNYSDYTIQTLERKTEPTSTELAAFNGIYGKDVNQVYSGLTLVCDGNPEGSPSPGPWTEATCPQQLDPATGLPVPISSITIAIHFPQGLRRITVKGDDSGKSESTSVSFGLEYYNTNSSTWVAWSNWNISANNKDGFTYTVTKSLSSSEIVSGLNSTTVRVRRLTGDNEEDNENYRYVFASVLHTVSFTRNVTPAIDPVNCKLAKTAFKIKATDQLNGQLEGINAVVQTYALTWNGTAWVMGNTSNPAALFRYVLEHPANPRRITDASTQINLTQLQYWHNYCSSKGFEFNYVLDGQRSILDVLKDICAAGRASPILVDGKWSVAIDEAKSVVQHFTPHNSWGFEGSKALPKIPDGLRINYIDQDQQYQSCEVIVYNTGKSAVNAELFESIELPGVTKKSLVIDHARWHFAQAKLRPETYTLNTDIEYLVCNRGDRVKVTHDVPMWGLASGRIDTVYTNLLKYSEEFNQAIWSPLGGVSVTPNAVNSPTGTLTADKIVITNITDPQIGQVVNTGTAITGKTFTFSVWAWTDAGQPTSAQMFIYDGPIAEVKQQSITLSTTPQRFVLTGTFTSSGSTTVVARFDLVQGAGAAIGNYVYLWGAQLETGATANAYIPTTSTVNSMCTLDETVPMVAGTQYTVRFRSKTGTSTTRTVAAKTADGYYDQITLTSGVLATEADTNDLFMIGELNNESQDLIVLSIEPTDNKSAKLVLVDYGVTSTYNIFTDYATLTESTVFETQITLPPTLLIDSFGTKKPTITAFLSNETVMDVISTGVFAINMMVSYTNDINLPNTTDSVEVQYNLNSETTDINLRSVKVPFASGSALIGNVIEGETYKVRMRYVGRDGRTGEWTSYSTHTITGKSNPPGTVAGFSATADFLTGKVILSWTPNGEKDLKGYEVRKDNTNWGVNDSNRLFYGNATSVSVKAPALNTEQLYYVKAFDYSRNYSTAASSASFTTTAPTNYTGTITSTYADTSTTDATVTFDWTPQSLQDNLVTFPSEFDNAAWAKSQQTITANAVTAPDGSLTADKLIATAVNTTHYVYRQPTLVAGQGYRWSIYAKAGESSLISLWHSTSGGAFDSNRGASFNLTTGTVHGTTGSVAPSIVSFGNGWYQISIRMLPTATATATFGFASHDAANTGGYLGAFAGDGVSGLYVWGAELEYEGVFAVKAYELTLTKPGSVPTVSVTTDSTNWKTNANWIGDATLAIKVVDVIGNKSALAKTATVTKNRPNAPASVTYVTSGAQVRAEWLPVAATTLPIGGYEVRKNNTNWGIADSNQVFKGLTTSALLRNIAVGANTFYVNTFDTDNVYAQTALTTTYTSVNPNPVSGLTATITDTALTTATVTFKWDTPAVTSFDIDKYNISFNKAGTVITASLNSNTWTTDANWVGNATISITTVDVAGQTSTAATLTIAKLVPANVGTVTATAVGDRMTFTWEHVAKTTLPVYGYEVRNTDANWGLTNNTNLLNRSTGTNTWFVEKPTTGSYTYKIKAFDTDSNYSATATNISFTVTKPGLSTISAPVFANTSGTGNTVTFNWTGTKNTFDIDRYNVSLTKPGNVVVSATIYGSTWTTNADWIGDATLSVTAIDVAGNSGDAQTYTATKTRPTAPTTVTATAVTNGTLKLVWNEATIGSLPIEGYELRLSGTTPGTAGFLWKGTALTTVISELALGANSWDLWVYDTDLRYSTAAKAISYTVTAPGATTITSSDFSDSSLTSATVTLKWNEVLPEFGLKGYRVQDGASLNTVVNSTTITLPADWLGNKTFTVKTIDNLNNESSAATKLVDKQAPNPVNNFRAQVIDNNVLLYWDLPTRTSLPISHIELRKDGTSWETASVIGEKDGTFTSYSELQKGNYKYWIKVVDTDNVYSSVVSITVDVAQPPDFVFNKEWISFLHATRSNAKTIDYKTGVTTTAITGNGTTATATFATQSYAPFIVGSTLVISNAVPSTYNGIFTVTACTTSSVSWSSTETITATTQGDISFVNSIALPVNLTETFQQHFSTRTLALNTTAVSGNGTTATATFAAQAAAPYVVGTTLTVAGVTPAGYNGTFTITACTTTSVSWASTQTGAATVQGTVTASWATPSTQVSAGYPIYIQPPGIPPALVTGYYEETFDYGTILGSSQITVNLSGTVLYGSPTISPRISTSLDNISYTDYDGSYSIFGLNFRYVKIRITASQNSSADLYRINNLSLRLDAKQITDSGSVSALSTDTNGTIINFNKEIIDVTSITVSPQTTAARYAVYDFKDVVIAGTYSVTSNVATINATAHGLLQGQKVRLYFTTGTATSGVYTIASVINANSYTVNITTGNTSGNVTTYPNSMTVYVFDTSGTRQSNTVSWNLRGY